jgi:hypothetical protein
VTIKKKSAVIDRIVDGKTAVLLFEEGQAQYLCPVDQLPEGSGEGSWLLVVIEKGKLVHAELDEEKNRTVQGRIRTKLSLLRRRMVQR